MKKFLATLLSFLMIVTLIPATPAQAASENKKPDSYSYIQVIGYDSDGYIDWSKAKYVYAGADVGDKASTVKGLSYDKKSNTLTINGYNKPKMGITAAHMGSSFKIVVKGTKNNIQNLSGFGSLHINGTGKLVVNKNKKCMNGGIDVSAENEPMRLVFGKKVNVVSFATKGSTDSVCVTSTLTDVSKAVVSKGGTMSEFKEDGTTEGGLTRFICSGKFTKK